MSCDCPNDFSCIISFSAHSSQLAEAGIGALHYYYFFFGPICSRWKFLGQVSNWHHSSDGSDNTGSLTCSATKELQRSHVIFTFLFFIIVDLQCSVNFCCTANAVMFFGEKTEATTHAQDYLKGSCLFPCFLGACVSATF